MAKIQKSNMTAKVAGKIVRKPKDNASESANLKWWLMGEKDMAASIQASVRFMQTHQSPRIEQLSISTRLYGSTQSYSLMGAAFARTSNAAPTTGRLTFNLCASVIDTLESKMAKNKVIPTFITNGGMWGVQKKAKQLTKFTQGWAYQEEIHKKKQQAFKDGGTWGDGLVYVYDKLGKAVAERALPHEIWVDAVESTVAKATQLHYPTFMERQEAKALFPTLAKEIEKVSPPGYQEIGAQGTAGDLIVVTRSWRLPSSKDAKDGLFVVSIGDKVHVEEWEEDYFPFPHFRYSKRMLGFYGQGACERLQCLQGEVNRGMITIQRSHHLMSGAKIAVSNTSKIVKQHLDNEIGTIITHNQGEPPQYLIPPIVQPEVYSWVDSLIEKGYKQEGVSQMTTTGEAPIGVESGKALRTLTQINDDRFLNMSQDLEDFVMEIYRQAINVVKKIYKDKGEYKVIFPDKTFMETVDWKEVELDEEQYVLKAFPTSSLSDDLTGRLSEIQEMAQAGFISPRTAKKLMDMPDIEMNENLSNAAEDLICNQLEEMLHDGKEHSPEQFNDLTLAEQLALQYYNYAVLHNCPEKRLSLVRTYLAQINDFKAQAAQGMTPTPTPQANPTATPTTNLVPNVNTGVQ